MTAADRVVFELEWRLVASERDRRSARQAARRMRRRRGLVLGLFAAALLIPGILATSALAVPDPYARAALAVVNGQTTGSVSAVSSKTDNEDVSGASGAGEAVTWTSGRSDAYSCVVDGILISTATVSLTDVSLFGGRVTAASVELVADAAATSLVVTGGVDVSRIEGLTVDGEPVDVATLPLTVPGLGTVTALESRQSEESGAMDVEISGLRVHLTAAWRELPADTDVVVGDAAASADRVTAGRMLPKPVALAAAGGTSGDGSPPAGASAGTSGGAVVDQDSSGDSGSSGHSGSSADSPSKRKHKHALLSFPGAVFPVIGAVWYLDDARSPHAVGGHLGCDIYARRGTPVVAVRSGTITKLHYRSLEGNSFHLDDDAGNYFAYAHLLRYAAGIDEGVSVQAGQVIGYVGNTGNAIMSASHVHFEIHPESRDAIDPYPYLQLWQKAAVAAGTLTEVAADASPPPVAEPTVAEAELASRHEEQVATAGVSPQRLSRRRGFTGLLVLALAFGITGGLVTSAVRRYRVPTDYLGTRPTNDPPKPAEASAGDDLPGASTLGF